MDCAFESGVRYRLGPLTAQVEVRTRSGLIRKGKFGRSNKESFFIIISCLGSMSRL